MGTGRGTARTDLRVAYAVNGKIIRCTIPDVAETLPPFMAREFAACGAKDLEVAITLRRR